MHLVFGSIVVIIFGLLLIKAAIDRANDISTEINAFRDASKISRSGWVNTFGTVTKLGINVDYPGVIFNWPKQESYDSEEAFNEAIVAANKEVHEISEIRSIFGNVLIEYSYTDQDGNDYVSRTVSRLPDQERDKQLATSLRLGEKVSVYYPKDRPEMSVLKKTNEDQFKEYMGKLVRPALGQAFGGTVLLLIGIVTWMTS